ncbi:MAG TPA: sensor histidine kinase [Chitinophagaceae bacterium]|nr:sensor histidine kinase [Chitinophagaceae bacterium]
MRKRYYLALIYFSIHSLFVMAQSDPRTDSLLASLKYQKNDTGRVNTLNLLSRGYLRINNIPGAKKYAADALVLAEKLAFKNGIKNAINNTGNIQNQLGNINYSQGNYAAAIKNYLLSLSLYEKTGARGAIGYAYLHIGQVYWVQRKFSDASGNYSFALKIFEEISDKNGKAAIYNNMGLVYENQGQFQEALKYYFDAIKMYEEIGNKGAMIDRYFNIGFLYEDQGNYPEALKNHQAALRISEELGYKNGIAAAKSNIGNIYNNQSDYAEALANYLVADQLFKEAGNQEGLALAYLNLGGVYTDLGDYSKARQHLNDALSLSKELEISENIKIAYELMTKLDSATGNWKGALENHKAYILYRDSLSGEEVNNKIMQAQMQYDFNKKGDSLQFQQSLTESRLRQQTLLSTQQHQTLLLREKELAMQQLQMEKDSAEFAASKAASDRNQGQLALLQKEKEVQTLDLIRQKQLKKYLLAGLALMLILGFFIYRNYRNRQQLKLQLLRNKIASDLHDDIGSTLSSISIFSQMARDPAKEITPLIETIGEHSRKMLDAMADIVWTINPENDQFEKIILRMRSFAYELLGAKNIDFEFIADEEVAKLKLPMDVRKNLYLIFKEATNNMVKYSGASKAMFTISGEKKIMTLMIRDNGKGFDIQTSRGGNGLKNMKKRAEEIGAKISIDSHPGDGTTIELSIAV